MSGMIFGPRAFMGRTVGWRRIPKPHRYMASHDRSSWTEITAVVDGERQFIPPVGGLVTQYADGTEDYTPPLPKWMRYDGGQKGCPYCGARSIPHTEPGRALMCPACGAPMP